mgnify:CR=1 FL=1
MGEFIYNEETRIHTLDGKVIPSVSNIVEPLSMDYSRAHPGKLERKRDLGNAFHECIRLFLEGDLGEESIDEELVIPMRQFEEFWTDDKEYVADAIYDWKLRKYDPVCDPLRMAGYEGLLSTLILREDDDDNESWKIESPMCNEKLRYCGKPDLIVGNPPRKLIVVEFSLDGGYRVHDADKKQAWSMYRKLLEFYWKKQEFETLCENWRKSI